LFAFASEKVNLPLLLASPESKELNINEIKKTKVLIFINRTCPCTQQNIPYVIELSKEFPTIEFIGIHSVKTTTQKDIDDILSQHHPKFSIVNDKDLKIANILKANRTPQTIILSDKNEVLYNGGITNRTNPKNADKLYLKNALVEISNNKEVTEKETRSLGCVILR
jgi:hypothetical protein